MPAPSAKVGDIVEFTSHLAEPTEANEPWYAPAGANFTPPPPPKYRQTAAVVVGINADGTIDVQAFQRSSQGVTFHRGVPHNSSAQQPGSWRLRP